MKRNMKGILDSYNYLKDNKLCTNLYELFIELKNYDIPDDMRNNIHISNPENKEILTMMMKDNIFYIDTIVKNNLITEENILETTKSKIDNKSLSKLINDINKYVYNHNDLPISIPIHIIEDRINNHIGNLYNYDIEIENIYDEEYLYSLVEYMKNNLDNFINIEEDRIVLYKYNYDNYTRYIAFKDVM